MTKSYKWLLSSLLITFFLFLYLAIHHYQLHLGFTTSSLCEVNHYINCDAAALSQFSEFLSIPLAVWGGCLALVLFVYTLLVQLKWLDLTKTLRLTMLSLYGGASVISVIMAAISWLYIKVACPFCVATYVMSFINLFFALRAFNKPHMDEYTGLSMSSLYGFLAVPFLAWFISTNVQEKFGLQQLAQIIPEKISQWQSMPNQSLDLNSGIIKKNTQSKYSLIEFADFKCPHCKMASQSIKNFLKANQSVDLIFKPFPLDGQCNPVITMKGDGTRCTMAAWALCADKIHQKGSEVSEWFFKNQEELGPMSDISESLKQLSAELLLNESEMAACAQSIETLELIKKLSLEGKNAGVEGTPSFYLNYKKLNGAQFIDVLQKAVETLDKPN